MTIRSLLLMLSISCVAGCAAPPSPPPAPATPSPPEPPPGIALLAAFDDRDPGGAIHLSLSNKTDKDLRIEPLCGTIVQVQSDGRWLNLWRPDCSRVRVRPQPLMAGQTWTGEVRLEPWLDDAVDGGGRVRVIIMAWGEDIPRGRVVSNSLRVSPRH